MLQRRRVAPVKPVPIVFRQSFFRIQRFRWDKGFEAPPRRRPPPDRRRQSVPLAKSVDPVCLKRNSQMVHDRRNTPSDRFHFQTDDKKKSLEPAAAHPFTNCPTRQLPFRMRHIKCLVSPGMFTLRWSMNVSPLQQRPSLPRICAKVRSLSLSLQEVFHTVISDFEDPSHGVADRAIISDPRHHN